MHAYAERTKSEGRDKNTSTKRGGKVSSQGGERDAEEIPTAEMNKLF